MTGLLWQEDTSGLQLSTFVTHLWNLVALGEQLLFFQSILTIAAASEQLQQVTSTAVYVCMTWKVKNSTNFIQGLTS
jgi:hypothetical protein